MRRNRTSGGALSPRRHALWLALIYLGLGTAWILLSDYLAHRASWPPNTHFMQTAKGLVYVLVTACVAYGYVLVQFRRQARLNAGLLRERAFAEAIADTSPVGILVVDVDGTVSYANRQAEKELGLCRETLLAQRFDGVGWAVTADDGGPFRAEDLPFQRVRETLAPVRGVRHELHFEDGHRACLKVNAAPLLEGGAFTGMVAALEDVSEELAAKRELAAWEERFRLALESIPDVVVIYDRDLRIQFINAATRAVTGRSPEAYIGRTDEEAWPESTWRAYLPALREARSTERPTCVETTVSIPGERERYLRISCVPVLQDGALREVLGITHDLTEERAAAESLRRSESKYRRLHETMTDAFVLVDMSGCIREFNRTYQEMLGYEEGELYRLTYVDITPERWHAIEARIVAEQILPIGNSGVYEKEYRRKDGTVFPVELRTFLIRDDAGQPEAMWAIVRDITERRGSQEAVRRSEERLSMVASAANVGLWDWNLNTGEVWYSPEWKRQIGYEDHEVGNRLEEWRERVHPADLAPTLATIHAFVHEPWPDYSVQFRFRHRDGSYRWILAQAAVREEGPERHRHMLGSHIDITGQRLVVASLVNAQEEARLLARRLSESTEAERTRLARELHDQVAQSLSSIGVNLGFVAARLTPGAPADIAERLESSLDLVEQTARSIRDVMAQLRPLVLDDYGLVPALEWLAMQHRRRTGMTVVVAGDAERPRRAREVETALFRIAQEALENTRKHAGAGSATITLQHKDAELEMVVSDDGAGFDAAAAMAHHEPGHLGLLSMRERALAVGGGFEVTSAPGEGTRVRVVVQETEHEDTGGPGR